MSTFAIINRHVNRLIDDAFRTISLSYTNGQTCLQAPCAGTVWNSGFYDYDLAGNIIQIGDDRFLYDRLA